MRSGRSAVGSIPCGVDYHAVSGEAKARSIVNGKVRFRVFFGGVVEGFSLGITGGRNREEKYARGFA